MGYRRVLTPRAPETPEALTPALIGLGMRFTGTPDSSANIEDTLLFASQAGLDQDDLRVLAVLVSWLEVHASRINVDRLIRIVSSGSARVRAFWAAVATWPALDVRFRRLEKAYEGERIDLLTVGSPFQIRRHGEDPRFSGSPLRVPANVLRERESDVLGPEELVKRHRAYRYRVLIGPSYRADMFAALEAEPSLSAAALARKTYGSFATAWQVRRDFTVLHGRSDLASEPTSASDAGRGSAR